jgi:hypothetical protein
VEKGTTVERLKIIQRSVNFKAGNLLSGPEIPPLDKISGGRKFLNFRPFKIQLSPLQNVVVQRSVRGPEIPKFPALENLAKSFTKGCGAAFGKGGRKF